VTHLANRGEIPPQSIFKTTQKKEGEHLEMEPTLLSDRKSMDIYGYIKPNPPFVPLLLR
jgi:hypothetical protein